MITAPPAAVDVAAARTPSAFTIGGAAGLRFKRKWVHAALFGFEAEENTPLFPMAPTVLFGVIGANAKSRWARESHIPALRGVSRLELVAVSTGSRETADEAANAYGVTAYDNGLDLARSPDVDIVTVATRFRIIET